MATFTLQATAIDTGSSSGVFATPIEVDIVLRDGTNTISYTPGGSNFEVQEIFFTGANAQAINFEGLTQAIDAGLLSDVLWQGGGFQETTVLFLGTPSDPDEVVMIELGGDPLPGNISTTSGFRSWDASIQFFDSNIDAAFDPPATVNLNTLPGVTFTHNDLITGTAGTDFYFTAFGSDTINGGLGDDRIFVDGRDGGSEAFLADAGGTDTIVFEDFAGNDAWDFVAVGNTLVRTSIQGHTTTIELNADGSIPFEVLAWYTDTGFAGTAPYALEFDLVRSNDPVVQDRTVIVGGQGADTITASSFGGQSGWMEGYGAGGRDLLIGSNTIESRMFGGAGDDTMLGGDAVQDLRGQDGDDSIVGGASDDLLRGDNGNDTLNGALGDDNLIGGGGDDDMRGGSGDDLLQGQAGNDSLAGSRGNDLLIGGDGLNRLAGQKGNDTLEGGAQRDVMNGGGGFDSLVGGDGNDRMKGGARDDILRGGNGPDLMFGNADNDVILGGTGDDTLNGGGGNDLLDGFSGDEFLKGGTGADRFVFKDGYDADRIADFELGADRLVLDAGLLGGATTGAQVVANFASVTGGQVVFDFGGGDTLTLLNLSSLSGLDADISIV